MSHTHLGMISGSRRLNYIVERMRLANERMLNAASPAERIRAGRWVVAWALGAGVAPPSYLRLRTRCEVRLPDTMVLPGRIL